MGRVGACACAYASIHAPGMKTVGGTSHHATAQSAFCSCFRSGLVHAGCVTCCRAWCVPVEHNWLARKSEGGTEAGACAHALCSFLRPQETGLFQQKAVSKSMQETMASDPSFMVDMMKKNLTGIVPQVGRRGQRCCLPWPPLDAAGPHAVLCERDLGCKCMNVPGCNHLCWSSCCLLASEVLPGR